MISITTSTSFAWFAAVIGIAALCVSLLVERGKRSRALLIGGIALLIALYLFVSNSVTLL
jgi:hypothetical protein